MLIADPLFQIALDCFRVGEAVKGQIAKAKSPKLRPAMTDMTMSMADSQPTSMVMKITSATSIAIWKMTNRAS